MVFLLIAVPLALLCAYLTMLAWRGRHRRVAVSLGVASAAFFSLSLVLALGGYLCIRILSESP